MGGLAAPAAVAAITVLFAAVCAAFARQPVLASFADDGVSYLVMAQVFSPWQEASAAVADAFPREAFYPPLFPLVLALAGVAHDTAAAYTLTALIQAACLPFVYLLGVRLLEHRGAAALATAAVALLPSLWVHAKGILSEPQFSLVLLALLVSLLSPRRRPALIALLMSALVLTRTMGLVLVAAYALWALSRRDEPWRARLVSAAPAAVAALAYGAWLLLRPADTSDHYGRIIGGLAGDLLAADNPLSILWLSLVRQAQAMAEAWVGSVMLFWVEGQPARVLLAGAVGALALGGLVRRLLAGAPDGWLVLAHLVTFLLWPFNDQVTRFLLPVLPILVLYAFEASGAGMRALRRPAMLAQAVLALLVMSLSVPGLAFIHGRTQQDARYAGSAAWYRTPDLDEARSRAQVHLDLLADMQEIGRLTRADERVMWYAPAYVALLADRRAMRSPDPRQSTEAYRAVLTAAAPDYVFLSVFHPRDTRSDAAWQAGIAALAERSEVLHARQQGEGYSALLLRPMAVHPQAQRP